MPAHQSQMEIGRARVVLTELLAILSTGSLIHTGSTVYNGLTKENATQILNLYREALGSSQESSHLAIHSPSCLSLQIPTSPQSPPQATQSTHPTSQ